MQTRPRVIILSLPKSGTYLVSEILRRLGFHQTFFHLRPDSLDAYDRELFVKGKRNTSPDFFVECPIEQSVKLVRSGEFAAGHLACTDRTKAAFAPFKVVHARRELRASMVSRFRVFVEKEPERLDLSGGLRPALIAAMKTWGANQVETARGITGWLGLPGVIGLTTQEIKAIDGSGVARIASGLGVRVDDAADLLHKTLDTWTPTKSNESFGFEDAWSEDAERMFQDLGGTDANEALGFGDDTSDLEQIYKTAS